MVGLAVTFDLGRYHATAWGAHVNEGTVEWPPSPWRLLRAVYASGLQNVELADARVDLERAIVALARAEPPGFDLPAFGTGHTRHYVPLPAHSPTRSEATSLLIDAFYALSPSDELRAWWAIDLDAAARKALGDAAGAVGYLGRSESVCSMTLLESPSGEERDALPVDQLDGDERWHRAERVDLLTLADDIDDPLGALGTSVTELRRGRMLVPPGTRRVTYAVCRRDLVSRSTTPSVPRPTLAHLRAVGGARPALTDAVTVGHLLRASLQRRFDRERSGARSTTLSGHGAAGPRRDQHAHAHYLSLPGRDRRRIDHLLVWAPEGFGAEEVTALTRLRSLRLHEAPEPFRVALVALGPAEELAFPPALGPSARWRTLTPFMMPRHPKRRRGRVVDGVEDQVRQELLVRGLPEPQEVQLAPGDWMRFARTRPGGPRRTAAPAVGIRLRFTERVPGPIALGALSHFGLGLFVPDDGSVE